MRSRLDAARDSAMSSVAVRHAARYAKRFGSAFEVFQRRLNPAPAFLSFESFRREPVLRLSGPRAVTRLEGAKSFKIDVIKSFELPFGLLFDSARSTGQHSA